VDVICDSKNKDNEPKLIKDSIEDNSCHPRVKIYTDSGCTASSFARLYEFFSANALILALTFSVLGLFFAFFGEDFPKIALFTAAFFAAYLGGAAFLFGVLLPDDPTDVLFYLSLGICVVLGLLLGFLASSFMSLGILLLGAWLGATLGMTIYNALFSALVAGAGGNVLFWIIIGVCAIAGAIFTIKMYHHALIVGTSLLGGYLFMRGVSLVLGEYPSEILVFYEL